jgi:hypothetical protein
MSPVGSQNGGVLMIDHTGETKEFDGAALIFNANDSWVSDSTIR